MRKNTLIGLFVLIGLIILSVAVVLNRSNNTVEFTSSPELDRVVYHYNKRPSDSLKLKAAIFLIKNIEGKYSWEGKDYSKFREFLRSIDPTKGTLKDHKTSFEDYFYKHKTLVGDPVKALDIQNVTADFLINHIDKKFQRLYSSTWAKNITFEEFCEYVLPYRIEDEPLDILDLEVFDDFYEKNIQGKSYTIENVVSIFLDSISKREMEITQFPSFVPAFSLNELLHLRLGTCRESSFRAIKVLQNFGVPVAYDYIPHWPHRRAGHSWCGLIKDGKTIDFEGSMTSEIGNYIIGIPSTKLSKVYRKTFSKNAESLHYKHETEPIPDIFDNPNFLDVSSQYFEGINIAVTLPRNYDKRFSYISTFHDGFWKPIDWSEVKNGKSLFKNMGKSIVYLPVLYHNENYLPISYPILVDSLGIQNELIPKKDVLHTISLYRKYPVFDWWNTRLSSLIGGKFQGSNDLNFKNATNLHVIDYTPRMAYYDITLNNENEFKYFRYLAADSSFGDIAEVHIFNEKNQKLTGNVIGTSVTSDNSPIKVFDDEPLTYFQGDKNYGNYVGLSFEFGQKIKRIKFLPRNDDNQINVDEEYELFYWDKNGWVSLGKKLGDDTHVLVYTSVPENALLLLRNLTKGKEERIFTYENEEQVWW